MVACDLADDGDPVSWRGARGPGIVRPVIRDRPLLIREVQGDSVHIRGEAVELGGRVFGVRRGRRRGALLAGGQDEGSQLAPARLERRGREGGGCWLPESWSHWGSVGTVSECCRSVRRHPCQ